MELFQGHGRGARDHQNEAAPRGPGPRKKKDQGCAAHQIRRETALLRLNGKVLWHCPRGKKIEKNREWGGETESLASTQST